MVTINKNGVPKMNTKYSHILWDWNGTLLNDAGWCVDVTRRMLKARGIAPIGEEGYRATFGFPVIEYYKRIGYDLEKESFDALSVEFTTMYHEDETGHSELTQGAESVLKKAQALGITQVVLSASRIDHLLLQINRFGLMKYFDEALGLSDIYAASKLDAGREYMKRTNVKRALLIGDTTHDCEVAEALGADCVLYSKGHQARERLLRCGPPVIDALEEILNILA